MGVHLISQYRRILSSKVNVATISEGGISSPTEITNNITANLLESASSHSVPASVGDRPTRKELSIDAMTTIEQANDTSNNKHENAAER